MDMCHSELHSNKDSCLPQLVGMLSTEELQQTAHEGIALALKRLLTQVNALPGMTQIQRLAEVEVKGLRHFARMGNSLMGHFNSC